MLNDILGGVLGKINLDNVDLGGLAGQIGGPAIESALGQLQQGSLGEIVQSWAANGASLPNSFEELQAALGPDMINQLAGTLGVDPTQLTGMLPGLVEQFSANGLLSGASEAAPNLQDGIGRLIGGLFR